MIFEFNYKNHGSGDYSVQISSASKYFLNKMLKRNQIMLSDLSFMPMSLEIKWTVYYEKLTEIPYIWG